MNDVTKAIQKRSTIGNHGAIHRQHDIDQCLLLLTMSIPTLKSTVHMARSNSDISLVIFVKLNDLKLSLNIAETCQAFNFVDRLLTLLLFN